MSVTGQKVSLSMKDVDQGSGRDLNPAPILGLETEEDEQQLRNPDRPIALFDLQGEAESGTGSRVHRVSSPEKWEVNQMLAASCIDKSQLPDFDEETGMVLLFLLY